jgi:hypothetical protein
VKHFASPAFWEAYDRLPERVRHLADHRFEQLKADPAHPSLHLKQTGRYWSARVGLHYRTLTVRSGDELVWSGLAAMPL